LVFGRQNVFLTVLSRRASSRSRSCNKRSFSRGFYSRTGCRRLTVGRCRGIRWTAGWARGLALFRAGHTGGRVGSNPISHAHINSRDRPDDVVAGALSSRLRRLNRRHGRLFRRSCLAKRQWGGDRSHRHSLSGVTRQTVPLDLGFHFEGTGLVRRLAGLGLKPTRSDGPEPVRFTGRCSVRSGVFSVCWFVGG